MKEARYTVKIEGIGQGLLMNNPAGAKFVGATTAAKPTLEEEAKNSRYVLPDDRLYMGSAAVWQSIVTGATKWKVGKKALVSILAQTMRIDPEDCLILLRDGKPILGDDYEVDVRRVVITGSIPRARAWITLPWQIEFDLLFDTDVFARGGPDGIEGMMPAVIQHAGRVIGIGDFRPGGRGKKSKPVWTQFGQYQVASFTFAGVS